MKEKKTSTVPVRNLRELYELYSSSVFNYLISVSGNRELAEDLTGETFYRAMLAIDSFRGESSVKTWLIRIARNFYLRFIEPENGHTWPAMIFPSGSLGKPAFLTNKGLPVL